MITLATRFAPRTFDRESRTLEAVAATAAIVDRGGFLEQLDIAGADLSQLIGAPVLDSHDQSSIEKNLGTVTAARIEAGQLVVTMRLNARAEPFLDEIEGGTIGAVSVGYSVESWARSRTPENRDLRIAKRWTPKEVSFVSLPADPGARVRTCRMDGDDIEQRTQPTATFPAELPSGWYWQPSVGAGGEVSYAAAELPAEGSRTAQLLDIQRRQAVTPLRATVVASQDEPAVLNARMGEALYARANPTHELSEPARQYFGLTMPEIAREVLRRNGETITGLGSASLITRALHSTSDFPLVLADTVNRTLRAAYGEAPAGVQALARQSSARDFRAKRSLMVSDFPALEPVGEHGEFRSGTLGEAAQSYAVGTFGRILGITRQALVNDDLGAFADLPAKAGRAARAFEADKLVKLLEANPAMSDGLAVFHATHGNLGTAGTSLLSNGALSTARIAMRKQTGLGGDLISIAPKFLVVPPEIEPLAELFLATIYAASADDVNPFTGRLTLVVEPRLTSASRWYLAADPASVEGMEYAHLEGAPGPQIETSAGFAVDGIQVKVRLDFGCGWLDYRGWWSSASA